LATEYELMRQARSDLESVRRMLESPTTCAIGAAVPVLERAASRLAWLEARIPAADPDGAARDRMRSEMLAVKKSLCEVRALVSHAADYFMGWAALVGLTTPAYGPGAMRSSRATTISFKG
jgi:hypothetical protein